MQFQGHRQRTYSWWQKVYIWNLKTFYSLCLLAILKMYLFFCYYYFSLLFLPITPAFYNSPNCSHWILIHKGWCSLLLSVTFLLFLANVCRFTCFGLSKTTQLDVFGFPSFGYWNYTEKLVKYSKCRTKTDIYLNSK